jgi:hypothetical protein
MKGGWFWLAIAFAGCAEDEIAVRAVEPVQLARQDPTGCAALAPLELRTAPNDAPTSERLREEALDRGANYVVVDTFRLLDDETSLLTRARLYRCPTGE